MAGQAMAKYRNAVDAEAADAGDDFQRQVGAKLGGLNAIGALRSGAAPQALQEVGKDYSDRVGRAAARNTLDVQRMEQDQSNTDREFGYRGGRDQVGDARDSRDFGEGRRRYDTSMEFDRSRDARDFGRQVGRDSRSDFEADRDSTFRKDRSLRQDFDTDREFGEGTRRYDTDARYRTGRAAQDDLRDTRDAQFRRDQFGEDRRRFGIDDAWRRDRSSVDDARDVRDFGYRGTRDARGDFESDRADSEGRRRYEQDRRDQLEDSRQRRRSEKWGMIAGVAGSVLGAGAGAARSYGGGGNSSGNPRAS